MKMLNLQFFSEQVSVCVKL